MKTCITCKSNRIAEALGKVADCFSFEFQDISYDGYIPDCLGIGGDNMEIEFCLDCGQLQGKFPITDEVINEDKSIKYYLERQEKQREKFVLEDELKNAKCYSDLDR